MSCFSYYRNLDYVKPLGYVARVVQDVSDTNQLFETLHNLLCFPEYDGRNWGALHELLRDFHWIADKEINLIHHEIPKINADHVKTYLEILDDSIKTWLEDMEQRDENTPWKAHILHVYFPEDNRSAIESIMGGCKR